MKTLSVPRPKQADLMKPWQHHESDRIDQPYDVPDSLSPEEEPDDSSDLDDADLMPDDDARWDVFIPDDDEFDPAPDLNDFWFDDDDD